MSELKPCPFCSGISVLMHDNMAKEKLYNVYCIDCYASSLVCNNYNDAKKAWNTRAKSPENEIPKLNDELLKIYRINEKLLAFVKSIQCKLQDKHCDDSIFCKAKELLKEIGEAE